MLGITIKKSWKDVFVIGCSATHKSSNDCEDGDCEFVINAWVKDDTSIKICALTLSSANDDIMDTHLWDMYRHYL